MPNLMDQMTPGDHVCWSFEGDDQRRETIADYVQSGLDQGQKIVCCTDAVPPDALLTELRRQGVATTRPLASGQLRVDTAQDIYRGASFDQCTMLETWAAEIDLAQTEGWAGLRAAGDMSWAAGPVTAHDQLLSYEAEVNRVFSSGYAMALCLYDRRLFNGGELNQLATAHPGALLDYVPTHWSPQLRIRRTVNPPGLRLSGEADLSNRRALAAVLAGLDDDLGQSSEPVTIDVTELRFADGAAAHMLANTTRTSDSGSRLVGCSPALSQVLAVVADQHTPPATIGARP